jgi:hypothetical protein
MKRNIMQENEEGINKFIFNLIKKNLFKFQFPLIMLII